MSDFLHQVYVALFNPNHEFSFPIFLMIVVACVVVPNVARYMVEKNAMKRQDALKVRPSEASMHGVKHKKKKK